MLKGEQEADEETRSGFYVNTNSNTGAKQYVLVRAALPPQALMQTLHGQNPCPCRAVCMAHWHACSLHACSLRAISS